MNPRRGHAAAGVALAVLGGALALVPVLDPGGLRAPPFVLYAIALAVAIAGWILVARAHDHELLKAWLPVALLACLISPALWLAFGPGRRTCAISAFSGVLRLFGIGSDLMCRVGFGLGSVVGVALVILAIRQAILSTRRR